MSPIRTFLVLCIVLGSCAPSVGAEESQVEGNWTYAFAELIESDGKAYKTSVSGGLTLTADGQFQQSRRIGGVLNPGKGTFMVKGDRIVLKYSDGSKSDTYTFTLGDHTDSDGVRYRALTLVSKSTDGSGFKYLLTKKN